MEKLENMAHSFVIDYISVRQKRMAIEKRGQIKIIANAEWNGIPTVVKCLFWLWVCTYQMLKAIPNKSASKVWKWVKACVDNCSYMFWCSGNNQIRSVEIFIDNGTRFSSVNSIVTCTDFCNVFRFFGLNKLSMRTWRKNIKMTSF